MAAKEIPFSQKGGQYESDAFQPTSENIVIRVDFDKQGSCDLYRSIDGKEGYVQSANITPSYPEKSAEEVNVSGIKIGQYLKIVFHQSVPAKIMILE
jgi:hypothetical protein